MVLVFAAFVGLLFLAAFTTGSMLSSLSEQEQRVAVAELQLTLVQQMTKESLLLSNAAFAGEAAALGQYREQLSDSMRAFEQGLASLRGDEVATPLEPDAGWSRRCKPVEEPEVRVLLDPVSEHWTQFKRNLTGLLASEGRSQSSMEAIVGGHLALLGTSAVVTERLSVGREGAAELLLKLQLGVLGLGLILVGVGGWVVRYTIVQPLRRLTEAARLMSKGNLSIEVHVQGTTELVDLGESFDRMRASLLTAFDAPAAGGTARGAEDDF